MNNLFLRNIYVTITVKQTTDLKCPEFQRDQRLCYNEKEAIILLY